MKRDVDFNYLLSSFMFHSSLSAEDCDGLPAYQSQSLSRLAGASAKQAGDCDATETLNHKLIIIKVLTKIG